MYELLSTIRREPAGALLAAANVAGLVLVALLILGH